MEKPVSPCYKVFPYRWIMLILLVPIIVSSEIFWLTFAPIASSAAQYYKTATMNIDLFATSYFIMYILFTIPASLVIEKFGYKTSLIIGAALTVVFGATRFLFSESFVIVLVSQFLVAAGQPFLVNISTKVPANWFAVNERATASGILVMAQYIGFIIPMILSPILMDSVGLKTMLGIYAAIALVSGILAVLFAKERPPEAPGPEAPKETMSLKNMFGLFKNKSYLAALIISFISLGLFNTIMTMIEQLFKPKGISSQDSGIMGAVFVVCGIIGAVVLPLLSDKTRKRIPFFITGISLIALLCVGLTFINDYTFLAVICGVMGFVIMGLGPILFQHGAEVAYPVQEGASFGTIMMMGQISGALFVLLFGAILGQTNSILWPMLFLIVLAIVQIPIAINMKDSKLFIESRESQSVK